MKNLLMLKAAMGRQKAATYAAKVKAVFGSSLIGYWPLDEASGSVAYDRSGSGRDGTYAGMTLGQPGIGDGKTSAYSDGVHADYVGLPHTLLDDAGVFNGKEGTFSLWFKANSVDDWRDGANHGLFLLQGDATNNYIKVNKRGSDHKLFFYYRPGGTDGSSTTYEVKATDEWIHICYVWSYSGLYTRIYLNGIQIWNDETTFGEWSAAPTITLAKIGVGDGGPKGYFAHAALGNQALTESQVQQLAQDNWRGFKGVFLSFDDARDSIYTIAFPYMSARNIPGTMYVVSDLVDTAGYITHEQLLEMQTAGWLIANHTKAHTQLATLSEADQETAISACKTALEGWGLTGGAHLAWPLGSHNADTFTAMANTGMLTGRNAAGTASEAYKAIDIKTIFPYHLEISKSFNDTADTLASIQALINAAKTRGGYAGFLCHRIATGAADGLSQAKFEGLIDWMVAEGIPCKTVAEMYADR